MAEDNRSTQSVNVLARDNLVTQGASGAAAVGAAAGVGMGLTVTALRASTQAVVGSNTTISARDDVTVDANSTKNINNTVISFGGGGSVGASGSVALTIVGGAMSGDSGGWFDEPRNVTRLIYALTAICLGLLVVDLLYHKHVHFDFEGWFGFYAFFGFLAFGFIVLAGKQLRKLLMRDEDYYDE